MQLLNLLKKTVVHCVWLTNGGRERLTTRGLLLTNYSKMHGISLANVVSCNALTFQLKKGKTTKKKWGLKWLQKRRKLELCDIYASVFYKIFRFFINEQKQATNHTKWALLKHAV